MSDHVRIPPIRRRNLPHWDDSGAVYSLCFRLADSLPRHILDNIEVQRKRLLESFVHGNGRVTDEDRYLIDRLYSEKTELYLEAGAGACYLSDPRIASLIQNALEHFNGIRYRLFAWCIMPNPVHVVCRLLHRERLDRILHSWKSFTALQANRILEREGAFWMREYYDRIIRNKWELDRTIQYVLDNPAEAGLIDWPWSRLYDPDTWWI